MFLSYTYSPLVVTTPLRPVLGPTGVLIANNFYELFNTTLVNSLGAAGLGSECHAWTGMNGVGGTDADNCVDFTSNVGGSKVGDYGDTLQPWFSRPASETCVSTHCIICICY